MKKILARFTSWSILIVFFALSVSATIQAQALGGLGLSAPASCPTSGCAAGQRLNLAVNYNLAPASFLIPNVQVCVFAPSNGVSAGGPLPWADPSSFTITLTGVKTRQPYTNGETQSICSNNPKRPPQMTFLGGAFSTIPAGFSSDSLNFGLRVNRTSNINGSLTVQIYDPSLPATNGPTQTFALPVTVAVPASPAYVANDAAGCGANSPCYLNSGDDLAGGIGTGLKDAVDAIPSPAMINILGAIQVKTNSIVINQPDTVQGMANASLISASGACANPMLSITSKVTLQAISIDGSACASPGRDLVSINSAQDVSLFTNNLVNGKNGVTVGDNTGNVRIEFNQIQGNLGYGILRLAGNASGAIQSDANNVYNNQNGLQIECQNHGSVDHNYWGNAPNSTTAVSNCTIDDKKRLGAPISLNPSGPGVDAVRIPVTGAKTSYFNQAISLQHASGDGDFDLYVINHGNGSFENVPFLGLGASYISPCSNYWSFFMPDSTTPSSLDAFFKYDLNPACAAQVKLVCDQGVQANFPLNWYDPLDNPTHDWRTTGSTGQTTACQSATNEIELSIPSGSPNHPGSIDLQNLPIVVGFPFAYGINLNNFTAAGSPGQVVIGWQTNSENNISGFYVSRSPALGGPFARVSALIPARGSPTQGGLYSVTDLNVPDGSTFFYRLDVIGNNSQVVKSFGPVTASTPVSTPTITLTPAPTFTPTITYTPTITPTPTPTFTATITLTPTITDTPTITPTPTNTATNTPTITFTLTPYRSPTRTSTLYYYYYTPTRTRTATTFFTASRTNTPTLPGTLQVTVSLTGTIATTAKPSSTSDISGGYPAAATDTGTGGNLANGYPAPSGTRGAKFTQDNRTATVKTPQPGSSTIPGTLNPKASPTPAPTQSPASQSVKIISLASGTFFGFIFLSIAGFFLFQKRSYR